MVSTKPGERKIENLMGLAHETSKSLHSQPSTATASYLHRIETNSRNTVGTRMRDQLEKRRNIAVAV